MPTSAGVLNIDKPAGLTSHDVVAQVRKITGIRRVGHAGTLDPLATGVLLVCVGVATRIVEYLQAGVKTYAARIRLGERTDTYDADGEVVARAPVPALSPFELERALDSFRGQVEQTPPMYSALKHKGRSLHEYARQGHVIERPSRTITMYDLQLLDWQPPDLSLRIVCSPGTYVRSLAHDLGQALGCGGHVRALRRLGSGTWRAEDAVALAELAGAGEHWHDHLHGLSAALAMLPPLVLPAEQAYHFALGQRLPLPAGAEHGDVRVFGPDERLVGIGRVDAERKQLAPYKVFKEPEGLRPRSESG